MQLNANETEQTVLHIKFPRPARPLKEILFKVYKRLEQAIHKYEYGTVVAKNMHGTKI